MFKSVLINGWHIVFSFYKKFKMKFLRSIAGFLLISINCYSQKTDTLPEPFATKSIMGFSNVIGWKNEKPVAPSGFQVKLFADGFDNPRWLCLTPDGNVLVAESNTEHSFVEKAGATLIGASKSNDLSKSANRIMLLKDNNNDGIADERYTFLTGLAQPFGMLFMGNWFYVANTDAVWRYHYNKGDKKISGKGEKIIDVPSGGRHWTRNIIANPENTKIYISIGSGTDHAENGVDKEMLRANIIEINPDGTGKKIYASGLRNPVGMDWAPGTKTLWTAVNERDELGDDLVPDYITSVKENGFYGWPYSYYGQHLDPRVKEQAPEIVKKAIVPDLPVGAHTASLGFAFYTAKSFPEKYHNGAFVAQHGSWNRSTLAGYKVIFVPFVNGKPSGKYEDFLTGFIADLDSKKVHGRPVGLLILPDGSMLVTDDVSNSIWHISANSKN
jgi:glucose/arabinose dehydrogenase